MAARAVRKKPERTPEAAHVELRPGDQRLQAAALCFDRTLTPHLQRQTQRFQPERSFSPFGLPCAMEGRRINTARGAQRADDAGASIGRDIR